jgi:imidazole glycerol phosphate synthase subunit HisF
MKKKRIHVTPHREGGWQVKKAGGEKASARTKTQQDAIEFAQKIAKREKGEVVIHGKNGRIRDSDSYGNDPIPPRDTKF